MVFCPSSQSSCEYYGYSYPYTGERLDENIERRQLIAPRVPAADYYPQQSRDYALSNTIACDCILCPANKNNFCETPALISINGSGQCRTGLSFVEPEKPKKPDECNPEPRNAFTPDWFYNRYDQNCPVLSRKELSTYRSIKMPGNWTEDVIRVNLEANNHRKLLG